MEETEGCKTRGVAATWKAAWFALRPREQSGSCSGQHAHTSALCLAGSGRMWLGHVHLIT